MGWQPKNDTQGVVFAIAQSGLKEAVRLGIVAVETLEMVALNYNAKVVRNEIVKVLGAISDARAIQTLVNLTKDRGVVDEAVKALQTICQNSAGMADNESLLTIAYLGAVYTTVTGFINDPNDCGGGSWQSTKEVDCSLLRQMARQELIRRGIKA